MTPPPAERIAGEGLRIRRWALVLLTGATPTIEVSQAAAGSSLPAWRAFLTMERCALPLFGAPAFPAALVQLPAPVRDLLEQRRVFELKRALSVRAQLQDLADAAPREGWRIIVLKGGVPIAGGHYLDLQDLDVLVPPEDIPAVARHLEQLGAGSGGGWEPLVGVPGRFHMTPHRASNALQVEVHYAVSGLGAAKELVLRSVPLESLPGLHQLDPADHLEHLLHHVAVHHPERIGSIRDAVLIRRALDALPGGDGERPGQTDQTPRQSDELPAQADELPAQTDKFPAQTDASPWQPDGTRTATRDLVAFARSLAPSPARTSPPPPGDQAPMDPFMAVAAAGYIALTQASLGREVTGMEASGTAFLLQGTGPWANWVRSILTTTSRETGNAGLRNLEERVPRLSAFLRLSRRGVLLLATLPRSWSTARAARELVRSFNEDPAPRPRG